MAQKDYKDTLNLPRTDFPMRANLPKREPEFLKFWEQNQIYRKLLEKRKNSELFILHDGPPYSNEHLHLGHALNKILKDIFVKYKAIKGYKTPFIPGWDNHGMPIENEVIKRDPELKKLRSQPNALRNVELKLKIREKSREFAKKWVEIQKEEFKRLGVLGDWENPYLTMDTTYEAQEVKIFAELVEQGFIYRGRMPIHWCPVCQTALAIGELEYKEKESPSLWFRTKVKDGKGILPEKSYIIVWTTTPWTIVANRAFAFHPEYEYLLFEVNGHKYLMAERLVPITTEILGWDNYHKIARIKGEKLEGILFEHPLFEDKFSPGILADFVTLEEGTGIVHIAPGHGKEDFEIGKKYGLEVFSPVDEAGKFTEEAGEEFKGLFVGKEGSEKAIEVLKRKGNFLHLEKITHSYPHCWRCKSPLIFRATTQWFLSVDHNNLRQRALKEITKVKWYPPETINRIYNSVKERPDWVLSRQRAWGVNIPVFYCKKCGSPLLDPKVMRHVAGIIEKHGSDAWLKLRVEELLPQGTKCPKCGSTEFEKEQDILDVWFDSGATNLIILKEENGLKWPADMYLEGSDQHRGWFNASLMLGLAIKGKAPYKTVVTHGWTLDEEGKAMHKSLGNVISPLEIIEKYGADVLRLWVASSDYTQDIKLGKEILKRLVDSYRKIRNTYRFMLSNLYDFNPEKDSLPYENLLPLDKYILAKYAGLVKELEKHYENLEIHRVYQRYFNFITVTLSSFYLDALKDRLYTWAPNSQGRRSAQTVIYQVLKGLLIVFSPILSFTCEEAWQKLPGSKEESVFLVDWPEIEKVWINDEIENDFDSLMKIRDIALLALEKARHEMKIINDRLEAELIIEAPEQALHLLTKYKEGLNEFFIVSGVKFEKIPEGIEVVVEEEDVKVAVRHKDGKKCARCWMWHEDVGKNPDYPDLCPKCIIAMEAMKNENKPQNP